MPREGFHNRMRELERDVLQMGETVIEAINQSVAALKDLNANQAKRVIANDALIDRKR